MDNNGGLSLTVFKYLGIDEIYKNDEVKKKVKGKLWKVNYSCWEEGATNGWYLLGSEDDDNSSFCTGDGADGVYIINKLVDGFIIHDTLPLACFLKKTD